MTVRKVVITFSRHFLSALLQLILILIVARLLGAEGAGAFSLAILIPMLMGRIFILGIDTANVFFVASGQVSVMQAWAASRDLMIFVAFFGTCFGAVVIIGASALLFPGVSELALLIAIGIFPVSLLMTIAMSLFQALQDFHAFNLSILSQPVLSLLAAFGLWLFDSFNLISLLSVVVWSHAAALFIALYQLRRYVSLFGSFARHESYLRSAISYGLKSYLANVAAFLNYRIDLFLVNFIVGPAAAGGYFVAVRLVEQLGMLSQAVSVVVFPRLSAMQDEEDARRCFTPVVVRLVLWTSALGACVLGLSVEPVITILFGVEFSESTLAVLILLPGVVALSAARVIATDIAARGRVDINLAIGFFVLLVNFLANIILISVLGLEGAAAASSLGYIVMLAISLVVQSRISGTKWWHFIFITRADFRIAWRALVRGKSL